MTSLFTTADVSKLRALGWPRLKANPESLGDAPVADWRLLDALNEVAKVHKLFRQAHGDDGLVEPKGFMNDVRDASDDAIALSKAFDKFAGRHETVRAIFDHDGELTELSENIKAITKKAAENASRVGSRHDPKINSLGYAAKNLIDLWWGNAGGPPTPTQGTRAYPAGKCIHYVLDKLKQDSGGSLGVKALERLYKNARAKHNKQLRNAKTGK